MYQIVDASSRDLIDAASFIEAMNALERNPIAEARELFDERSDVFVSRAPGRLDVMGGIADYSGSLVLQMPIREATFAALQRCPSNKVSILSLVQDTARASFFEVSMDALTGDAETAGYERARARFKGESSTRWAAYVAGAFPVLMRERGILFEGGARILIDSRVPEGKGVGSSAALEVAAMQAIASAFDCEIAPRDLALLCQKVENLVVGAPCGVMDQMTAVCGEEDSLLALLCQPAEVQGTTRIPDDMAFWGVDSGLSHSIGGADYRSVRAGAFIGYRMIADMAGLKSRPGEGTLVQIDDPNWSGYLANMTTEEFEALEAGLPEQIAGAEFLSRFQGTTDPVTAILPEQRYAVRLPTAHPVYESARVNEFAELIKDAPSEARLERMGALMCQSHASYSACGLGSDCTDLLVRLVREAGAEQGLYGARITGGGSGGTVAVIGRRSAHAAIQRVADQYAAETGYRPHIFSGSSAGSAGFGCVRLRA